ncbi:MAG: alcohol acetyltransferase, partial [Eubacteriales bacterium]|nr:alcohol acetyltransferase [Eubacteriales bacterium]
ADPVSQAARRFKVSVTELLVGVYLYQLYQIQQQGGYHTERPVRVSVPINVRRFYPSQTVRNFALYANPGIEPAYGSYSFEEVLGLVHHFMRYTINEKYLNAMMCANVAPEKSLLLRISPLPIKNLAMRLVYTWTGESRFTSTVSNLGVVNLPPEMASHVERLEFMLGPSRYNPVNCAVISTNGQVVIQFSATMEETDPQRAFFRHLVRLGIPVRVESNRDWDEFGGK